MPLLTCFTLIVIYVTCLGPVLKNDWIHTEASKLAYQYVCCCFLYAETKIIVFPNSFSLSVFLMQSTA